MSTQQNKATKAESVAGSTLNETMLKTFRATDGKEHNVKWLATQALDADKRRVGIAENMLNVAKDMTAEQFKDFDKDVRASMKWGKAPTAMKGKAKDAYGATPRTWKNAVSVINQCFTHKVDIKHYPNVFGEGGLNSELRARKDALGANNTSKSEGSKAIETLYPEIQGAIMHITALDTAIKAQPDASTMLELAMVELNDAIERVQALLTDGIDVQTTGDVHLLEHLEAEKADKNASKQASK